MPIWPPEWLLLRDHVLVVTPPSLAVSEPNPLLRSELLASELLVDSLRSLLVEPLPCVRWRPYHKWWPSPKKWGFVVLSRARGAKNPRRGFKPLRLKAFGLCRFVALGNGRSTKRAFRERCEENAARVSFYPTRCGA